MNKTFESCVRSADTMLEFSHEFTLWCCEMNIIYDTYWTLDLFCMGWEL